MKNNPELEVKHRKQNSSRQEKYRNRLGIAEENIKMGYSCKQTLGKALKKVENNFPDNEDKKKTIVTELVKNILPDFSLVPKIPTHSSSLIAKKVRNFLERDDISRQTAGKRDYISIKNAVTGQRQHFQKRFMVMTVGEAYSIFIEENSEDIKKYMF